MKKHMIFCSAMLLASGLFGKDVYVDSDQILEISDVDANYIFGADNITLSHYRSLPRHVTNSVYFQLASFSDIVIRNNSSPAGGYFGWNGANIVGNSGSSATLDNSESSNGTLLLKLNVYGAAVNINYFDLLKVNGNAQVNIYEGGSVYYNSRLQSSDTGVTVGFYNAGSTSANVIFTQDSLTSMSDSSKVLYNIGIGSGVDVAFDSSYAKLATFRNTASSTFAGNFTLNAQNILVESSAQLTTNGLNVSGVSGGELVELKSPAFNVGTVCVDNATVKLSGALDSANRSIVFSGTKNVAGSLILDLDGNISGNIEDKNTNGKTLIIAQGRSIGLGGRITSWQNETSLIMESNSSLETEAYSTSSVNGNNNIKNLVMRDGSAFTVAGGLRLSSGEINGSININGSGSVVHEKANTYTFGIYLGEISFGPNARLTQKYQDGVAAPNWIIQSKVVVNSGIGSLKFGNSLNLSEGTEMVLNTADAFVIGKDAAAQADSTFNIGLHYELGGSDNSTTLTVNAENNIGSFSLDESGHVLKIRFGEFGALTVGESPDLTSFTGDALAAESIVLEGDIFRQLRVYDLSEDQILRYFTSDTGNRIYVMEAGNGSYWVNTVIPEPARLSLIFGAIALVYGLLKRKFH